MIPSWLSVWIHFSIWWSFRKCLFFFFFLKSLELDFFPSQLTYWNPENASWPVLLIRHFLVQYLCLQSVNVFLKKEIGWISMVSCWDRQETGSWTSWKVTVRSVLLKRRVIKNFTGQRQRSSADVSFRWIPCFHVFKVAFFGLLCKKKVLALTLTRRSEVLKSPETVCMFSSS